MNQPSSHAAILSIGTAVPTYRVDQEPLLGWMTEALRAGPSLARWLRQLYKFSGITTRYACIPDALLPPTESRFAPGRPLEEINTTIERMAIYERESVVIASQAARRSVEDFCANHTVDIADTLNSISHLIVVSCTGFFAPGLDLMIARQLGLRPDVERTLVGFMGCAAAFNGMRLASHIVRGQPAARVLVVCVELCSLHIQPGHNREDLISASLFADGAAACLIGATPQLQGDHFDIYASYTNVQPDTESDMIWRIGNHGFELRLSPQIPGRLGEIAPQAVQSLIGAYDHLRFWAIHPGGRAIVDRLAEIFQLTEADVAASRAILRDYGNMSSPTILFVLHAIREQLRYAEHTAPAEGVAMAFGPGLVIEMAHLAYVPAAGTAQPDQQRTLKGLTVEQLA